MIHKHMVFMTHFLTKRLKQSMIQSRVTNHAYNPHTYLAVSFRLVLSLHKRTRKVKQPSGQEFLSFTLQQILNAKHC